MEDNVSELIDDVRISAESSAAAQMVVSLETGEVLYANPAAARFYGWMKETLSAMLIDDLDPGLFDEMKMNGYTAGNGATRTICRSHFVASGEKRPVDLFAGTISTRNVTLLHVFVQGSHAAADSLVGRKAVGTIIHDFNNQLTVIRGTAALLREHEAAIATLANDLDVIDRATDRSIDLLQRLRELVG